MGHLLGTSPARAGTHGMTERSATLRSWVEISAVRRHSPLSNSLLAFAIDSPNAGDRFFGQGFEIHGWVIAPDAPVQGVRTLGSDEGNVLSPLTERRPDVAADYPAIPHAKTSGFLLWVPIDPARKTWDVAIEAVLASGAVVRLAELSGTTGIETLFASPGTRLIGAPDFVIIGTQRGGTTSLHAYLSAHPRIETPATKELHYFTDRFERGRDWYLGQFPVELRQESLSGEATPYALFHPLAPRRLEMTAPGAKLIALLRNPIDRAYSHYLLARSRGDEPLDFCAALNAEDERLAGEEVALRGDPTYRGDAHKNLSYLARGDYATQLERWFALFPRDQFIVLRSEDFFEETAESLARVTEFLEIPPVVDIPLAAHNRTTGPPLEPAIRDRLRERFAARNARLADLLGWNPGWE